METYKELLDLFILDHGLDVLQESSIFGQNMKFITANSLMGDFYKSFTVRNLSEQKKKELAEKIEILCRYTGVSGGIDT